jgi:hypothetical protein
MIKGSVTMELNEATLIDALQEYFDKRLIDSNVLVKSVSSANSSTYGSTFKVSLEEKQKAKAES